MLTRNKKLLIFFAIILSLFIFRKELFQDKQNTVPLEDELHHESPKIRKVSTNLKRVKFMMIIDIEDIHFIHKDTASSSIS